MIQTLSLENYTDIAPLFDAYRIFYKRESDIETVKKYLFERIKHGDAVIFGYYDAGVAVAFTLCYFTFQSTAMVKTLQLNDLFVTESHRNQGIGEMLIQHVFDYAKDNSYMRVSLETAADNVGAQRLYERIGFNRGKSIHYHMPIDVS